MNLKYVVRTPDSAVKPGSILYLECTVLLRNQIHFLKKELQPSSGVFSS